MILIFSKNRACQLDLLLRSVKEYGLTERVVILYKTDGEYKDGYELLKSLHSCEFVTESNFKNDSLGIVQTFGDKVAFCTDDCVFYRPVSEIPEVKHGSVFSLRLGLNTTMQDCHTGRRQPFLNNYASDDKYLYWSPHNYHPYDNYGYPLALDLHIFKKRDIIPLISSFEWRNSNQLESGLQQFRNLFTQMSSFKESVAVNIPYNNMSGYTASQGRLSQSELNSEFMNGKRIKLDFKNVIGCHQYFDYVLE